MRKTAYGMSVCALLLSVCLLLTPTPAYARQRTVVRTENVLPAVEPPSAYTSDWLSEGERGNWPLLRLEDWVVPAPSEQNEEPEAAAEDGGEVPVTGEDSAGESENSGITSNSGNKRETFPLANKDNIVYNTILQNTENWRVIAFHAAAGEGEALSAVDFAAKVFVLRPGEDGKDWPFEVSYLTTDIGVEGDEVSLALALSEQAAELAEATDVYIEVSWQGLMALAVTRLIPEGQEPDLLISEAAQPEGTLYVPVSELPQVLALLAEGASGDWVLRVTVTDKTMQELFPETTPNEEGEAASPPVFRPVENLGVRTAGEERWVYLNGEALVSVPTEAAGRLLLDLSRTGLSEGTVRLESFGARLPETVSALPDAELGGGFILSPEANAAVLKADPAWLGCQTYYLLESYGESGYVKEETFRNLALTPGEGEFSLSLVTDTEDKFPAGTYRLTLYWDLPSGTLYEKTISFFVSY